VDGLLASADFWRRGAAWQARHTTILDGLRLARSGPEAAK
jgi:hypothetical protein